MLMPFDVGLSNKRLVLDTRYEKRERTQQAAPELLVPPAQACDGKPSGVGVHTIIFAALTVVYVAVSASDWLDSEPHHGTKVHLCILSGVPLGLVYQHVRAVRLRFLAVSVLLHSLALVALLGFAGGLRQTHIAADILIVVAAVVVYYLTARGTLCMHKGWACGIVVTYLASLAFVLAFRYTQIVPLHTLMVLEAAFVLMSLGMLMLTSRGDAEALRV